MSGSVNKVLLVGRLGKDPEVKFIPSGDAVCNFDLATSEQWKDKEGNKQERTEWHRIVVWNKLAELCGQYLFRGSQAYIEGQLQTRKWKDKNDNDRYTTEIKAREVIFLGGKTINKQNDTMPPPGESRLANTPATENNKIPLPVDGDNVPF